MNARRRSAVRPVAAIAVLVVHLAVAASGLAGEETLVFPRTHWQERPASELGLNAGKLDELAALLGGRGCVIKDGWLVKQWGSQSERRDWLSSAKPVLSTLLFFAVDQGKLSGVDARIAEQGWALSSKDRSMTFRHLANMVGGYARPEEPGKAWAYNDYAIMLYQKTLFDRVFASEPNQVAARCFAPLGLEDGLDFEPKRRRLRASVRDFARLAWFWLSQGSWDGSQVLPRRFFEEYQRPHVPADLPVSRQAETDDYLKIGTYGGGSSHFSDAGPGIYGFNWWFNAPVPSQEGRMNWPDAPADAFMSLGAGGNCSLMIPSLRLVVVAASANWGQNRPGRADSVTNQLIRILMQAAGRGAAAAGAAAAPAAVELPHQLEGEAKLWHPLTLTLTGPRASETSDPNPFRDYRLTVTFARGGRSYVVPGYFAADGAAAETSAEAGDRWEARFTPPEPGEWAFSAELVEGRDVALDDDAPGKPIGVARGTFSVGPSDKRPPDARATGLLRDVRERYYVYAGTDQAFLKGGADSPENLLAFAGFDGTRPSHHFEPHARDWRPGDPTWKDGRGKNLIGVLNYLAGKGMNSIYFLTMNVKGDGKDVWPWTGPDEHSRFDVSKLAQWEIVFSHMDRLGIMLHVVHQEQENDQLLDRGALGPDRKLYYRELIARFGHHPALVWNLGEENTNTTAQLKSFARYIHKLDPYDHPIVVHTFPSQHEKVYAPLLGDRYFSGASLQVGKAARCAEATTTWLARSAAAGRPWACFLDEIGPARDGVVPDNEDPDHDVPRREALWAPLMVGGAGCEWLFGTGHPHGDTTCEDLRSRDRIWDQTRWALEFFRDYVPVRQASDHRALLETGSGYCLAQPGKVYAIYLPAGGACSLRLESGRYRVDWYDPRAGGGLKEGSVAQVSGPGVVALGSPPSEPTRDWAIVVRRLD